MNTNHLSELWPACLVIIPIFTIIFGVSAGSVYFGVTKYSECPFQPFLTQGIIGFGLPASICSIVALILIIVSFFEVDDSGTHLYYWLYAFIALSVYGISAVLLASFAAYVFMMKDTDFQSENSNDSKTFCHASIYNFCHGFIQTKFISQYIPKAMGHLARLCEAFIQSSPVFAVLFSIAGGFLFLGITKYDECPFEPFLSQDLIRFGLISLICTIGTLILMVMVALKVDDSGTHLTYLLCAFAVMAVYGVASTILAFNIGSKLYAKDIEYQSENPKDLKTFCHASVYNLSYGFVATVSGLVLMFIIWFVRYLFNRRKLITTSRRSY